MIKFRKYFSLLTFAVLCFDYVLLAKEEQVAIGDKELEPTKLMQGEARWLAEALQRAHYSKVSVE